MMQTLLKKISIISAVLLFSLLAACSGGGGSAAGGVIDPDTPTDIQINVNRSQTIDVEVIWVGEPNDGSYTVVIDEAADSFDGEAVKMQENAVAPTVFAGLQALAYGEYNIYVVPINANGEAGEPVLANSDHSILLGENGSNSTPIDIDGDGIPNGSDPDVDGDGILNGDDPDVDGDGILNGDDSDVDGDGIPNGEDDDIDGDGILNGYDDDIDGDGILNGEDDDIDGDGILNGEDDDIDGDGILNGEDDDIDGDGIPNGQDDDIDGDGIPNGDDDDVDGDGILNGDDNDIDGDGILNENDDDIDGDGIVNENDDDIDGDGIPNSSDPDVNGDGDLTDPEDDFDGDGITNENDTDADGDGYSNVDEEAAGSNPYNPASTPDDIDGDGYSNDDEIAAGSDPYDSDSIPADIDGDGILNGDDPDVDGDGLLNGEDDDVDGDGILNGDDPDVDGDGILNGDDSDVDGDGILNGDDPDVDGDGILNGDDPDVDGDGILNGSDPDVDGDGILNGSDPDVDGDGILNGDDPDVDGDGILNGSDPDVDGDGILNGSDPDVDGDGLLNGDDPDVDGDGILNGDDPDVDGDGLLNGNDNDIDGDGIDNDEDDDMDGDGIDNDEDDDDDGDGLGDLPDTPEDIILENSGDRQITITWVGNKNDGTYNIQLTGTGDVLSESVESPVVIGSLDVGEYFVSIIPVSNYGVAQTAVNAGSIIVEDISQDILDALETITYESFTFVSGDTDQSVTQNFQLSTVDDAYGTTISWSSQDPLILITDGGDDYDLANVDRPQSNQTDKNVQVKATVTKGSQSGSKVLTVKVKKLPSGIDAAGIKPGVGANEVSLSTTIEVPFTGDIATEALQTTANITLKTSDGDDVAGTINYATRKITFTPAAALTDNTTYTFTVSGLIDASVQPIEDLVFSFTTYDLFDIEELYSFEGTHGSPVTPNSDVGLDTSYEDDGIFNNVQYDTSNVKEGQSSLKFDGSGDNVILKDVNLGDEFSYAVWVYLEDNENDGDNIDTLIANAPSFEKSNGFKLFVNSWDVGGAKKRDIVIEAGNGTVGGKLVTPENFVNYNGWYHFVITVKKDLVAQTAEIKLYFNGVEAPLTFRSDDGHSITEIPYDFNTSTEDIYVGQFPEEEHNYLHNFKGNMDDIRVYKRVLTSEEVARIAKQN
jgi:hypothetical protein